MIFIHSAFIWQIVRFSWLLEAPVSPWKIQKRARNLFLAFSDKSRNYFCCRGDYEYIVLINREVTFRDFAFTLCDWFELLSVSHINWKTPHYARCQWTLESKCQRRKPSSYDQSLLGKCQQSDFIVSSINFAFTTPASHANCSTRLIPWKLFAVKVNTCSTSREHDISTA